MEYDKYSNNDFNSDLLEIVDGNLVISSLSIASQVVNQHKNILELIRKYKPDFEEFGEVAFETRLNKQGSSTEIAWLNEPQATLLITYLKNTEPVRKFKKILVHEFYRIRKLLYDQMQKILPSNYIEALEAVLSAEKEKEKMKLQIDDQEVVIELQEIDNAMLTDDNQKLNKDNTSIMARLSKIVHLEDVDRLCEESEHLCNLFGALNPTNIGKYLQDKLPDTGIKYSGIRLNKALVDLGYQTSIDKIHREKPMPIHGQAYIITKCHEITDIGEQFGIYKLTPAGRKRITISIQWTPAMQEILYKYFSGSNDDSNNSLN